MAAPAAVLAILVEANTSAANANLAKTDAALRGTSAAASSTTTATSKASTAMKKLGTVAKWGGVALAAGFVIEAKKAVETTQDLAKTTWGLHENLGFTQKSASGLASVLKARGVDSNKAQIAFKALATQIQAAGQGSDTSKALFDELGISQRELAKHSHNLGALMPAIAKGLDDVGAGAARTADAQKLFGRGALTLLPILRDGAKAYRDQIGLVNEYGAVLKGKALKNQVDLLASTRESKIAFQGFQVQLANFVTPALLAVNEQFQRMAKIMADPKLTSDEKFTKIADIMQKDFSTALDVIVKMIPTIASRVGEQAPKIASGLVQGFLNANVWGKLLLGTWLVSKLGITKSLLVPAGTRAASGVATGVEQGMASSSVRSRLASVGSRVGTLVLGASLINGVMSVFSSQLPKNFDNVMQNFASGISFGIIPSADQLGSDLADSMAEAIQGVGSGRWGAIDITRTQSEFASVFGAKAPTVYSNALKTVGDRINAINRYRNIEIPQMQQEGKLTDDQAASLQALAVKEKQHLRLVNNIPKAFEKWAGAFRSGGKSLTGLVDQLREMSPETRHILSGMLEDLARTMHTKGKLTDDQFAKVMAAIHVGSKTTAKNLNDDWRAAFSVFASTAKNKGDMVVAAYKSHVWDALLNSQNKSENQSTRSWKTWLDQTTNILKNDGQKKSRLYGHQWDDLLGRTKSGTKAVTRDYFQMIRATGGGLQTLGDNTNNVLGALKVGKLKFSIKNVNPFQKGGVVEAQMGTMVPGHGSGDKVPAMLEPGEVVINRQAVRAMGGAQSVNQVNAMIPRFAKGGFVFPFDKGKYSWGRTDMGVDFSGSGPIRAIGAGRVIGTGALGWPQGGGVQYALDQVPPGLSTRYQYVNEGVASAVRVGQRITAGQPIGRFIPGSIEQGQATSSGAALAASHYSEGQVTAEGQAEHRLLQALESGHFTAAAQIARVLIKGPDGPLKAMGQAALDKIRKVANAYIGKKSRMGTLAGGVMPPKGADVIKGKVSWFTGGTMASGANTDTSPGIAVNLNPGTDSGWNNPTTQGWIRDAQAGHPQQFLVDIGGHRAKMPVLDLGPAGFTGRAIDVDLAGVHKLGIDPAAFPTDSIGTATLLKMQKGGIVGMQTGGAAKPHRKPPPKPHSHIPVRSKKKLRGYLNKIRGLGLPKGLADSIASYTDLSDTYEEYANRASALTYTNETAWGGPKEVLGVVFGRNEAEWLGGMMGQGGPTGPPEVRGGPTVGIGPGRDIGVIPGHFGLPPSGPLPPEPGGKTFLPGELQELFQLRNALIRGEQALTAVQARLQKQLRQAKKQLDAAMRTYRRAKTKVDKLIKKIPELQDKIKTDKDFIDKHPHDRARKQLLGKHRRVLARDMAELPSARKHLKTATDVRDTLREKVIPVLTGQQDKMASRFSDIGDALTDVQGKGSPMTVMKHLPGLGVLGGRILDVQLRLRDLNAVPGDVTDTGQLTGLLQQKLLDTQKKLLISQLQYGVFQQFFQGAAGGLPQFAGAFAKGGPIARGMWGIAGEKGPEVVRGPAQVFSNAESRQMVGDVAGAGDVAVHIHGDVHTDGRSLDEAIEVRVNGQLRKAVASARRRL